jgi:nucleotide-binding universal stress UspA family protein
MGRVLASIDGSARSMPVIDAAVTLAAHLDATVIPMTAINVPPELGSRHVRASPDALLAEGKEMVRAAIRRGPPVSIAPPFARQGPPWRVILDAARAFDADVIVVGSHGHGTRDAMLGSTAGRVAGLADRSVLVVSDRPTQRISTIVIGLDASEDALLVFDGAVGIARTAKVHLVHVVEIPPLGPPDEIREARLAACVIAELSVVAARVPGVAIEQPTVRTGPAWRGILERAAEVDADLIIVGARAGTLGHTASRVAHAADRHVFVVRSPTSRTTAPPPSH